MFPSISHRNHTCHKFQVVIELSANEINSWWGGVGWGSCSWRIVEKIAWASVLWSLQTAIQINLVHVHVHDVCILFIEYV